jgi:NAD+ synthase (glutamine-hydrolysing)
MVGGFAPLKDVPKTLIYKLANYRNSLSKVIPARTLTRAPTAELADNQTDQDTLPPYDVLDPILELYLNQQLGIDDICAKGYDRDTVTKVVNMIHKNEYKRRQAALGARINHTAFGKDRRYPVTSGFKG